MKALLLSLLAGLMATAIAQAKTKTHGKGKSARYPLILEVKGPVEQVEAQVQVVKREPKISEKQKLIKKGMVFKDKVHLRLGEKSQLRLALSESSTLILGENSELNLPEISWEDGATKELQLLKGSVRYICKSGCERRLAATIFEMVPGEGDYLFEYQPETPKIQVSVFSGELNFRGLGNETSALLKPGEKMSFTGALENEQPAFDLLLKGRKVAKGQLGPLEKVPDEILQQMQKQEQEFVRAQKKPPASRRRPSQICDKPWGELNQCAWICEGSKKKVKDCSYQQGAKCIRQRCNANGEWSDRQELPDSQNHCQIQPVVGSCDY